MLTELEMISDNEKSKYMCSLQKELDQTAESIENIRKIHEQVKFPWPNACDANFRDALFHYKKISELSEKTAILNEAHALREHLYRCTKDGLINYMQNLSERIELLYKYTKLYTPESISEKCKNINPKYLNTENSISNILITMKNENCSKEMQRNVFLYHYNNLFGIRKRKFLQKQIHLIRNKCLNMRASSLLIERPYEKDKKTLLSFLESIISEQKEQGLFSFIILSSWIFEECQIIS